MRIFKYDESLLKYFNKDSLMLPKNKRVLNCFLDKLSDILNIKIGNMIGLGFEGQVYEIKGQNKVIKLQPHKQSDYSDIATNVYLKGKKLNSIANVVDVGIIINNTFNNISINGLFNKIYYIVSEKLIVNETLKTLFKDIEADYNNFTWEVFKEDDLDFDNDGDNFLGFIDDFIDSDPKQYIAKFIEATKYKKEVKRVIFILEELKRSDIEYNDFVVKNFGFSRQGDLKLFDINGYEGDEEFNINKIKKLTI